MLSTVEAYLSEILQSNPASKERVFNINLLRNEPVCPNKTGTSGPIAKVKDFQR